MSGRNSHRRPPSADYLHPLVLKAFVGLMAWMALAAWGLFNGLAYDALALGVVTVFTLIAAAIPAVLWAIWKKNGDLADAAVPASFRDWMRGEFEIWRGHLKGREAAIQALLPMAAVAFGNDRVRDRRAHRPRSGGRLAGSA